MFDTVIKNGYIIDGTASPGFHSDIAIKDGKIVKIARNIEGGEKIIDATGLTVTPGFIDSHSHCDDQMFTYPDMIEKIEQGITTSISGQCGFSQAPVYKDVAGEFPAYGKRSEVCKTFGTMTGHLKGKPFGSNILSFIGHASIRRTVIGTENRKPTDAEMEEMKRLLRDGMENGAVGLSLGLIYTPSCYAETDELIELAKVVKEYDGLLSAHIRDEGYNLIKATEEFIKVIKATGLRAVFSHHKAMHKENWGKVSHTIRMIEEANREGYDVYCDVYPYTASHTSLSATVISPKYRAYDNQTLAEKLCDKEMRNKIEAAYIEKTGNNDLGNILVTEYAVNPQYVGKRINEIAEMRGQSHFDAALDLICESKNLVGICNFAMCEEDIETVMKYERTMICTDSGVAGKAKSHHPRMRGTFPRVLGEYVRNRKVTSLHEMIRKMTSMPAAVYGIESKGLIKELYDADICIFDADKIADNATYTDCLKKCEGLNFVLLSGEVVVENSVHNGKKPGRFILRNE